ncbi:unnamed protein product [Fraxinus pennsylvanica]|uniref:Uncharacterized protein n=1 Tax=Fraxinus pennsylvanica TaxID=56036 RepID=A0AAD2E345_9LAMI|nr:unnamed protein product [Fraxinus pennsylvanica]
MEKHHNYVRNTAELATQFIYNPATSQPNVSGLILAGSADFKTDLSQSDINQSRYWKYVFGVDDMIFGYGSRRNIDSTENLNINRYVLKNSTTNEIVIKHLNKDQEGDQSNLKDLETSAELEVLDKVLLLE